MPKVEFLYLPENGKSDLGLNLGFRNSVLITVMDYEMSKSPDNVLSPTLFIL